MPTTPEARLNQELNPDVSWAAAKVTLLAFVKKPIRAPVCGLHDPCGFQANISLIPRLQVTLPVGWPAILDRAATASHVLLTDAPQCMRRLGPGLAQVGVISGGLWNVNDG